MCAGNFVEKNHEVQRWHFSKDSVVFTLLKRKKKKKKERKSQFLIGYGLFHLVCPRIFFLGFWPTARTFLHTGKTE